MTMFTYQRKVTLTKVTQFTFELQQKQLHLTHCSVARTHTHTHTHTQNHVQIHVCILVASDCTDF